MPTPLGASNLPPPPPRDALKPPDALMSPPKSTSTAAETTTSAEKAEPLEAPHTQGVARAISVRKVQFDDVSTTRDSWLSPLGDDDGVDDLAKELERQATRAERQAASAQAQTDSLSPVPVKRLLPHRGTLAGAPASQP